MPFESLCNKINFLLQDTDSNCYMTLVLWLWTFSTHMQKTVERTLALLPTNMDKIEMKSSSNVNVSPILSCWFIYYKGLFIISYNILGLDFTHKLL